MSLNTHTLLRTALAPIKPVKHQMDGKRSQQRNRSLSRATSSSQSRIWLSSPAIYGPGDIQEGSLGSGFALHLLTRSIYIPRL